MAGDFGVFLAIFEARRAQQEKQAREHAARVADGTYQLARGLMQRPKQTTAPAPQQQPDRPLRERCFPKDWPQPNEP